MKPFATWPLAAACAALLVPVPPPNPEHTTATDAPIALADSSIPVDVAPLPGQGVALVMGGSGVPIPSVPLVQTAVDNYLIPMGFGDYAVERLFTPEGLQTIEGINKQLPFDTSVAQGVTILETEIKKQVQAGHDVFVGGVSQSATINAMVERDIHNGQLDGVNVGDGKLHFLSLGDPSNPNGGILERFNIPQDPTPSLPSLGLTFSGAAPADTGIPTTIYTLEYDGFADFPRYPINFLSDLNAVIGMLLVHPLYIQGLLAPGVGLTPQQIADAQVLATSPGYDGGTTYLGIQDPNELPLAQVIGAIFGRPIGDLLAPDLKVLVNLGYGADPDVGWSTTPADLATPAGLFPSIDAQQFDNIVDALINGAFKGIGNFITDILDPASIKPDTLDQLLAGLHDTATNTGPPTLTSIVDSISGMLSTVNGMVASTGDVLNALTTVLPANDLTIFANFLGAGDLTDAVGMPVAFSTGLDAVTLGVEAFVLLRNLPTLMTDFHSLF